MTEVFKGGSLGHGTAVEHHFDIDLVLYSRSKPPTVINTLSLMLSDLPLMYTQASKLKMLSKMDTMMNTLTR